jgi:hypothetical protein
LRTANENAPVSRGVFFVCALDSFRNIGLALHIRESSRNGRGDLLSYCGESALGRMEFIAPPLFIVRCRGCGRRFQS